MDTFMPPVTPELTLQCPWCRVVDSKSRPGVDFFDVSLPTLWSRNGVVGWLIDGCRAEGKEGVKKLAGGTNGGKEGTESRRVDHLKGRDSLSVIRLDKSPWMNGHKTWRTYPTEVRMMTRRWCRTNGHFIPVHFSADGPNFSLERLL